MIIHVMGVPLGVCCKKIMLGILLRYLSIMTKT